MRAALAIFAAIAALAPLPPAPGRWVEDPAGFLSAPVRARLDARLEAYEHATGHQIVVWIGKTLGGAALDDWAVRAFAAWKVGRKGLDDGVVLFVLADDRTIDLEVGYGLEGAVPDATASRIIREVMTPRLQAADRDGAVEAGVEALLAAIEGRPALPAAGPEGRAGRPEPGAGSRRPSPLQIVLGALGLLGLLVLFVKYPRLALFLLLNVFSRGGSGGRKGGGFGGGGGRSGGGGARGSW
jgi:uncharacterized protein